MLKLQKTDLWTFTFQLPPGQKHLFCQEYSVPSDNVMEWEATARGVEEASVATTMGLTGYFGARAKDQRSVTNFYITADMSKVDPKKVKTNLDDISDRFKVYEVGKEVAIKDFVEAKTGRPYVIGSAYYQLTKTEKVQPQKEVLVQEKGKKAVWGGDEARQLIGLPDGDSAKVVPGNMANWDVYIQSTSPNRKLVRGTKVLVDVKLKSGKRPTWDFEE